MDPKEVKNRDGKARETIDVSEHHSYLDSRYEIVCFSHSENGLTGRLDVARLHPKADSDTTLPSFLFRWDEKANALDLDVKNAEVTKTRRFKKGVAGFVGHHPKRLPGEGRRFQVEIHWDNTKLYDGQVAFSLSREVVAHVAVGERVSARQNLNPGS